MVPEQRFFMSSQCSTKFEKKNPKIAETPKITGNWKSRNQQNQQRKNKHNNSHSRSRRNNQHNPHKSSTNKPIKRTKKWPTLPRFETIKIQNYGKSETNNNDHQNKHIVTVPDKQDVSKQVEENMSSFVRDHFCSSLRMYKER